MNDWKPIRADELARILDGELHGDGAITINQIGTLDNAGPASLAWMGSANYAGKLAATAAGVVLIPLGIEPPAAKTVIRVKDPDVSLSRALEHMAPRPPTVPIGVHRTAVVAEDAVIDGACIGPHATICAGAIVGAGTQLHAGVYVGNGARIGRDCILWPGSVVRDRCILGDRVTLQPNAIIGADGFGFLFRDGKHVKVPQVGTVLIEDDVEIGANSCVDRAKSGVTRIGRGTKIDNLVQIGHNCNIGEDCMIVAQVGISGSVTTGNYCVFAGQAGVSDHIKVGNAVQVGAQACLFGDADDGEVLLGTPAIAKRAALKRELASRKLPELVVQLKELQKRIEQLESSANDRARS
ncbi:MAG: UDP-3-O-(3-hydroxymyristoyl)glucosamine N-acyltransferase [Phycisphaerae bacterium]